MLAIDTGATVCPAEREPLVLVPEDACVGSVGADDLVVVPLLLPVPNFELVVEEPVAGVVDPFAAV